MGKAFASLNKLSMSSSREQQLPVRDRVMCSDFMLLQFKGTLDKKARGKGKTVLIELGSILGERTKYSEI